jgi:hypothetical protein
MLGTIIGQVPPSVYLSGAGNNPKDRYELSVSLRNSGNHPWAGNVHLLICLSHESWETILGQVGTILGQVKTILGQVGTILREVESSVSLS